MVGWVLTWFFTITGFGTDICLLTGDGFGCTGLGVLLGTGIGCGLLTTLFTGTGILTGLGLTFEILPDLLWLVFCLLYFLPLPLVFFTTCLFVFGVCLTFLGAGSTPGLGGSTAVLTLSTGLGCGLAGDGLGGSCCFGICLLNTIFTGTREIAG
ncbi:hypothetical protein TI04_09305 [Achromatium sp. WMS2]|nr:hypothetical protein TI04_09305 [Achromatium sp. WMS2]